jgi:hypothetical protein
LKESLATLTPGAVDQAMLGQMLQLAGVDGDALPERMAGINELLNSLPPELTEQVLTEYVNQLFHYRAPSK